MEAVTSGRMSIRKSAELHNVPKSTLADRISGRILPGAISGPKPYLDEDEEMELVSFLLRVADLGFGHTQKEVIAIVERSLKSKYGSTAPKRISSGWWQGFLGRHPQLTLRTPAQLSIRRMKASNRDSINKYFDELEETMEENGLTQRPCQIFNVDETGMPLQIKPNKVVHAKGIKKPSYISSENKATITVVGCVSASGHCIPPMVIWDRKTFKTELANGEVPVTLYSFSTNGWMDQTLFRNWFEQHFLRYAPAARPLLLLCNGHSSHYCPEMIRLAAQQKIILFTFPPNTTHMTQPLDQGIFGPLKKKWAEACQSFMTANPGMVVTRYSFSSLFSEAWLSTMTPKNIAAAFRTTGIYPLSQDAVDIPTEQKVSLSEATGLAYIPLYTPTKRKIPGPAKQK